MKCYKDKLREVSKDRLDNMISMQIRDIKIRQKDLDTMLAVADEFKTQNKS